MSLDTTLNRLEFALLIGLAAFLPALEAPKNICMGLYLIVWALNRLRSGNWGGMWSRWDSLIGALIASGYLAAWFAGLPGRPLTAGNDILAYGLVFMTLRRSSFSPREVWWVLGALVTSTIITLGYGYWGYLVTKQRQTLGLHSVGHVNHSAIYMAIAFGIAFTGACAAQCARRWKILLWIAASILFVSLLVTVARGAILPGLLFIALWLFHWLVRRHQLSPWKFTGAALAAIVLALIARPEIINKTLTNIEGGQAGSYRPSMARVSLLAAREFPLFGVGPTQFGKITPEMAAEWQARSGAWFKPDDLAFASHAHGLYANTLAERGLVGLGVLLALLGAWGMALKREEPGPAADPLAHVLWGSALGAWVLAFFGGFLNTTLHHEHAMITAILMGLWMSSQRNRVPD